MQPERFARLVATAQGLVQGLDLGVAAQLSGWVEHVVLPFTATAATTPEMLDGVVGEVTNGDFLTSGLSAAIEPQGQ